MNLQTELDSAINDAMDEIVHAARKQDFIALDEAQKKAAQLKDIREQFSALENRLAAILHPPDTRVRSLVINGKLRQLPVQVTGGMIRQNLLTLAEHVNKGVIRSGEELQIEALPSGEKFRTILMEQGKKLQERGAIKQFYQDARVKEGDVAVLIELAPGRWQLRKGNAGEWDGHYRYKRVRSEF